VQVAGRDGAEDRKLIGRVFDIEYDEGTIPYGSSAQVWLVESGNEISVEHALQLSAAQAS
jgi:hypothetical protein